MLTHGNGHLSDPVSQRSTTKLLQVSGPMRTMQSYHRHQLAREMPQVTGGVGEPTRPASLLGVAWSRPRVPSYRRRELARGRFLIKSENITLLDCIGEGLQIISLVDFKLSVTFHSGEFGIVYEARLGPSNKEVAVKTLKGSFLLLRLMR